jgi:hypothetical protein
MQSSSAFTKKNIEPLLKPSALTIKFMNFPIVYLPNP